LAGALLLALFLWHEAHIKQPMLPLSLFMIRNFSVGNMATLAIYAALSVSSFVITLTLQQVCGYSALAASLVTLPVSVIMFVLSKRFGKLAGIYGPRVFMAIGPVIAAIGFLLMLRLQPHANYIFELLPGVLVFGIGLSMTVAPLTAAVLGSIPPARAGIASAVNNAVAQIAGLIAIAFIGIVTGVHLDISGFRRTILAIAGLLLVGALISAIGISNRVAKISGRE
jgi:hypothetical protein